MDSITVAPFIEIRREAVSVWRLNSTLASISGPVIQQDEVERLRALNRHNGRWAGLYAH